jgi:hypothetical protein
MTTTAFMAGSPAFAADVSSAGADSLRQVFERYVGKPSDGKPGYASVTVDGSAYKVSFDLQHALDLIPNALATAEVSPVVLSITPLDDGTWKVSMTNPLKFAYAGAVQSGSSSTEGLVLDGIFDPAIASFRTSTARIATLKSTSAAPNATATVEAHDLQQTQTGAPGPNGTTDVTVSQTVGPLTEVMHMDMPSQTPPQSTQPVTFDLRAGGQKNAISLSAVRAQQLLDLWAFVVAHPTPKDGPMTAPDEFKTTLQAALPVMDALKMDAHLNDLTVQTPYGKGTTGPYDLHLDLSTQSPSSSITFGLKMDRLAVDSVFVPEFARSLIPTKIEMNVGAKDFDFNSGMKTTIDGYDFGHPDPTYMTRNKDQIVAAWLPAGKMVVQIPPSAISAPAYTLGWQGSVEVTPGHAKTHIDVRVAGFDAVLKSLSQVKQTGAAQIVIGLYAAQALAKKDPDGTLTWAIDAEDGNSLLVNGSPVGPQKKRAL